MIKITDKGNSKYCKYYPDNYLPAIKNMISDLNFVNGEIVETKSDDEIVEGDKWKLFDAKIQCLVEFYNICVAVSLYRCPILFHTQLPNFIPTLTETMIHKYCEFNDMSFEEAKVHLNLLFYNLFLSLSLSLVRIYFFSLRSLPQHPCQFATLTNELIRLALFGCLSYKSYIIYV